jgi:M6 family metalloprotease-like protein
MKRPAVLAAAALAIALVAPFPLLADEPSAPAPSPAALSYDLERARAAMTRGAESVGQPPAEAAEYMRERPMGWRHSSGPVTLEQPDGSTFEARGLEIEEGGGQATLDGHLITQADDDWWHYGVRQDNGRIRATDAVVGRDAAPEAALATRMPAAFESQLAEFVENSTQLRQFMNTRAIAEAAAAAEAGEPVVFKIPALMYEVNNADPDSGDTTADDFQPEHTAEYFESQLSGIGTTETGTVTEMYLEQSFGKMVIEIDVYGPYEGALSQIPCFFGTEGAPITGDVLGLGGLGSRGMAQESVRLADPEVDFGQYDNNNDGWLDFLTILHSGPDAAATGNPCDVWSHYFGSIAGEPTTETRDTNSEGEPVLVGPVLTIPEIDLEIGVTAHEIMHALGEPDYYGTAGTTGTGDWDLGAGGSWSGIPAQTNPVHFNPVMKINFGWVEPTLIEQTALDQALRPRASYPDLLQVPLKVAKADSEAAALCDQAPVGVPNQNNAFYTEAGDCLVEGFLIENVNATSAGWNGCLVQPADFDRQLYGSGLMVWHWDFTNYESLGNNNILRPMLDIEEFDRRDARQDLGTGVTRGQPLDAFWGDPVGISGATQVAPTAGEGLPESQSWTVTSPPTGGAQPAEPVQEWEAAEVPPGTGMVVKLQWGQQTDDWDLYVDQFVDEEWVEVASSASGAPQTSEEVTLFDFAAGDRFRARAYNWLGPTSPTAEVSVDYSTVGLTQLGPAGTRNNDLEQTGWQITNIRPNDYNGLAHEAKLPRTPIVLDLVKHDETTVDVSGDFLRRADGTATPFVAGQPVALQTNVYNHGGKAVQGATFALYDRDPARGGTPLQTQTVDLAGFGRAEVQFSYTPRLGENDLYVVASAPGDLVAGNDVVRTELSAYPGGSDVLMVDHDFGWTFEQDYEAVLNGLGVSYDIVEGEPTTDVMDDYDAVIWLTTTVSGDEGVLSPEAADYIAGYLDGGGKLWVASTRAAGYMTTRDPEWMAGYFGLLIEQNLLNSPGTVTGLGGPIGGEREIQIGYMDGRPYIDYGQLPPEADVKGTATGLFSHELIPIAEQDRVDVVATSVEGSAEAGGFRTVYGLPINLVLDPAERVTLMTEVLGFLGVETAAPAPDELEVAFTRFQFVQDGEPWSVTIGAVSPEGVEKVELVHRPYGTTSWRTLELSPAPGGLFSGTIPGEQVPNNGLEYFARLTSGGEVVEVDGGSALPNVASAPYGDPAQDPACTGTPPTTGPSAPPAVDPTGAATPPRTDTRGRAAPTLAATGMQQLLLPLALLLLGAALGLSRLRRRSTALDPAQE